MESYIIKDLTFKYPQQNKPALSHVSLKIEQGQFITLCGRSGCGKSTLLKHLKSCFNPAGERSGEILFEGKLLETLDQRTQSEGIGFVLQEPDNQIVTDKVWHELAFGLESLGYKTEEIRARVAEMAAFFGIQNWFHKKTTELSGGQKQLLNLASIMVMQPSVLILDEPTSQLDPIAAQDFLETISKINRELGTTIILTEHRLEEAFPLSDRVIVMEEGSVLVDGTPYEVGEKLKQLKHEMFIALPTPMRIYAQVPSNLKCPITVREGRKWLETIDQQGQLQQDQCPSLEEEAQRNNETPLIEMKDIWMRYEKEENDILKGLNLKIYEGEWLSIVGGNGTGKTTTLSVMSGIYKPYRGNIFYKGKKLKEVYQTYKNQMSVLPQNPKALFVKKSVEEELKEMFISQSLSKEEERERLQQVIKICELEELLKQHPYDLSGGQQQRAALAKVLLLQPKILLLDEPTKGLDAEYKHKLAKVLKELMKRMKITIIMVSHDIEFCAQYTSRCAMFFDGNIVSSASPRTFFAGKSFYTTATNRMAREKLPTAVIPKDVVLACDGELIEMINEPERINEPASLSHLQEATNEVLNDIEENTVNNKEKNNASNSKSSVQHRSYKVNIVALIMILLIMPLTIFAGIVFWGDRKYYFVSLLLILETIIPFAWRMESKKLQARELMLISVLCAIGVAGRVSFYMLPSVEALMTIVIISAVCLGSETGFMIGAITAFASNMFLGQGPWTPWQMFSYGIIGFLAGLLSEKKLLSKKPVWLCIFGFIVNIIIFGGIMNPASVIMYQSKPNLQMFITAYILGAPYDLVHGIFTSIFLLVLTKPMVAKIQRIKIKYDLIDPQQQKVV